MKGFGKRKIGFSLMGKLKNMKSLRKIRKRRDDFYLLTYDRFLFNMLLKLNKKTRMQKLILKQFIL